jgi:SAM-dependent methyltransferase
MDNKDEAYCRYLLTSEVSPGAAEAHREILADHFWGVFRRFGCTKVLDIGCGLGSFISKAPPEIEAAGIDANRAVVEHCRAAGLAVLQGTAEQLSVDAASVDGIMCAHLMEHVADPERAFREFARVLREGGIMIVRVPPFDASFYDDWTHVRPYTKKSLTRLAAATGFEPMRVYRHHYDLPFRRWRNPLFRTINFIRRLPVIRWLADSLIRAYGLPPQELVLIARRGQP